MSYLDNKGLEHFLKNINDKFTPVVALLQEEYDALSDAEKNNGTIYFITDAQGSPYDITIDKELDKTSENAIANKAVAVAIGNIKDVTYTFTQEGTTLVIKGTDGTDETITLGGEITYDNVIEALGFTPANEDNIPTESTVEGWGFTKNTGDYSKPADGIPKEDLDQSVQSSLDKADSALQSFTEEDPTVPSYVKEISENDITNWNNKAEVDDIPDVPSWALESEKPSYTAAEVGALPDTTIIPEVPADVSAFNNDAGYITNIVDDLTNYYLKSETYTQEEVNGLVSAIPKFAITVVDALPTENISATTVYLLRGVETEEGNLYSEYIYVNNKWELLGMQKMDLSNYALKEDLPTALSELTNDMHFVTATDVNDDVIISSSDISDDIVNFTSYDVSADEEPVLYSPVEKLTAREKISSLFSKVSKLASNTKYLIKVLGNTDISTIGDGTLTGAVSTLKDSIGTRVKNDSAGIHGLHLSYENKNYSIQKNASPLIRVDNTYFLPFAPQLELITCNLNDLTTGMVFCNADSTNIPLAGCRYLVLTFNAGTHFYTRQIAFADNNNMIYSRYYDQVSGWSDWTQK